MAKTRPPKIPDKPVLVLPAEDVRRNDPVCLLGEGPIMTLTPLPTVNSRLMTCLTSG
jgi:hypothetical protein